MALPGVHVRAADTSGTNPFVFDATRAEYHETGGRMRAYVNAATVTVPVGDTVQLKANLAQDLMSGASPQFNAPAPGGGIQQVLSRATIREDRRAGDLGAAVQFGDNEVKVRQGWSSENDYLSTWTSVEAKRDFNQKNTTVGLGTAYADDRVWNVATPENLGARRKTDLFAGVTQVIDERSVVELAAAYSSWKGYLSDPYKFVFVSNRGLLLDTRPDRRRQKALTARYLTYLPPLDSSLKAELSVGSDSWGIRSYTFELQLKKQFAGDWLLAGGPRYYAQSAADFYSPIFDSTPAGAYSSDYRLARFGAIGGFVSVSKQLSSNFNLQLAWEKSYRRASLGTGSGTGIDADNYIWGIYWLTIEGRF